MRQADEVKGREIILRYSKLLLVSLFLILSACTQAPVYHQSAGAVQSAALTGYAPEVIAAKYSNEKRVEVRFAASPVLYDLKGEARGRLHGAVRGFGQGFLNCIVGGAQGGDEFGLLIGIVISPACAVVGAGIGVAGDSAGTVREYEAISEKAAHGIQPYEITFRHLIRDASSFSDYLFEKSNDEDGDGHTGQLILELGLQNVEFSGKGINPPVHVLITMQAGRVQASTGNMLFEKQFVYKSRERKLAEWAENKARLLKESLEFGFGYLGKSIHEAMFLSDNRKALTVAVSGPVAENCLLCAASKPIMDSLRPELRWYPAWDKSYQPQTVNSNEEEAVQVLYDLAIYRKNRGLTNDALAVYSRSSLTSPQHKVEEGYLDYCKIYTWEVRSRVENKFGRFSTPWTRRYFKTPCNTGRVPG